MKLVIDIPEKLYGTIKFDEYGVHQGRIYDIIRSGAPLPKGLWRATDKEVNGKGATKSNFRANCGAEMEVEE